MNDVVRIENWELLDYPFPRLTGEVYGHPKWENGKKVWTSKIMRYDREQNLYITKSGTHYELGSPLVKDSVMITLTKEKDNE